MNISKTSNATPILSSHPCEIASAIGKSSSSPAPILYQTDPLVNLLQGAIYTQGINLEEMCHKGNFGIGTFNGFKGGEMVLLGGIFYSMPEPQMVSMVQDLTIHTPFAMVTELRDESSSCYQLQNVSSYDELKQTIESHLISDPSKHYAVKIHGDFSYLKTQCVQEPLDQTKLLFKEIPQKKGEREQISATLAGFRLGQVDAAINYSGYHFHGMSNEVPAIGGHVVDLGITNAIVQIQELGPLEILRP